MRLRFLFVLVCLFCFDVQLMAINIQGELTRFYQVSPGEHFTGEIIVSNISNAEPKSVKIYQTDVENFADGSTVYGEPAGKAPRSNAAWIKFSPEILNILPAGKGTVTFEGTVPKGLEGSYCSMIMLEKLDKSSAELAGANVKKGQMAIIIKTRYAVRITTTVKGTGKKMIKFLQRQLNDKKSFQVDIESTGSLFFEGAFWVELFNQKGQPAGKFLADRPKNFYPGNSVRFDVNLATVAPGKYTALCALDAGDDDIFGARYQVDLK